MGGLPCESNPTRDLARNRLILVHMGRIREREERGGSVGASVPLAHEGCQWANPFAASVQGLDARAQCHRAWRGRQR